MEEKINGRPLTFKDPEEIWNHFLAYFKETKENPIKKHVFVGKDAKSEFLMLERPLTFEGFCSYLRTNEIIKDFRDYYYNKDNRYEKFAEICSLIRQEIRRDQIEGGLTGIYNTSITQRLNALKEQTENTHSVEVKQILGINIKE